MGRLNASDAEARAARPMPDGVNGWSLRASRRANAPAPEAVAAP